MQKKQIDISGSFSKFRLKDLRKYLNPFPFISIYLFIFPFISLSSQPDSLANYMEMADSNNPSVIQLFIEYQAALGKVPQAGSLPDPQLELGAFITPMEFSGGNQVADLRLMQMFPWFGVLKNARDEMSLMAQAKYELFRDTRLQVRYDVQRTWYDLFKVRRNIIASEKNLEILGVIERLALVKYKAPAMAETSVSTRQQAMQIQTMPAVSSNTGSGMQGMGDNQSDRGNSGSGQVSGSMQPGSMSSSAGGLGLTDLYRIRIEAGDLINSIETLKDQEQVLLSRFNGLLNRPPLQTVYTEENLSPYTPDTDLPGAADSIKTNNPMLGMLNYEREAYMARKKMATGMGYPMIGLGLNYSVFARNEMSASTMNGNDMIMPMISVTLPVNRKKYNAMRGEADLLSQASSQNYQAMLNSLNTEYFSAVQLYQDARRRAKLYEDQYQLASKTLEIMLKDFTSSAVSLTDVLRVRQLTLDYELKQVEAVADLNTAKAWLERLMGKIDGNRWK